MLFLLCKEWGPPYIHPDYLLPNLTERQLRDWENYYDQEPWGEERADWRMEAYQLRLMKRCWGSEGDAPAGRWPYWQEEPKADEIMQTGAAFDEAIEPDGKGGYRWKPGRGPQEVKTDGIADNRTLELHGDSRR